MNDLKVFKNSEFGELGVLLIDGKEYFPATACAKMLGYSNPQEAIRTHCKGVRKTLTPSSGGSQQVNYIPEGDLYRLIVRSKLPAAERFERWVFDEVLPAIRQQGGYISAGQIADIIQQTATTVVSEVVKQLIPVLTQGIQQQPVPEPEPEPEQVCTTIITERKRRRRNTPTKIESLPDTLQDQVFHMLANGVPYIGVSQFLAQRGYPVSQMSVCRYYNKFLAG